MHRFRRLRPFVASNLSNVVEIVAIGALVAGVYDLAGDGWALIAGGAAGIVYGFALDSNS